MQSANNEKSKFAKYLYEKNYFLLGIYSYILDYIFINI